MKAKRINYHKAAIAHLKNLVRKNEDEDPFTLLNILFNIAETNPYAICRAMDKDLHRLHLINNGTTDAHRIPIIKTIREHLRLGLKESKELTDRVPCVVLESHDMKKINAFKIALEAVGAKTEIR